MKTLEIRIAKSADGKHVFVRLPYINGGAEILMSVGAKWRISRGAWVIPAARAGDLECRLGDLRAMIARQWRHK